ncbi:hypothetical protein HNP38_002512 [Chryseobacterium defluvii]|uniref:Uncharacterized protein n=1 Tax=Chryseobacterium defluvii TaxID=160396 RepID=A0A840KGT3_9FLAO|nr:hypothetical protein [Chryseobacterium defluvii]
MRKFYFLSLLFFLLINNSCNSSNRLEEVEPIETSFSYNYGNSTQKSLNQQMS